MPNRAKGALHCVGTGFIALDIIRSALDENTTLERRHAGGSCGNVLAVLSYLGMNTLAVGRIGNDWAGSELLADLRRCKVDLEFLVAEKGGRTPIVIQETFVDARGRARHRFSRACPLCGATMPAYRPLLRGNVSQAASELPPHKFFFFDRVAPGALELARWSRGQGALIVFEPSGVKDEKLFIDCLRTAHVLKYSHERLSRLDALVNQARPPIEIETLGADGLRFRMHQAGQVPDWNRLAALPALSIRDSAGSGDWCTAGFLARLASRDAPILAQLENLEAVVDGLRFGQALAALNCSYDGARGLMYAIKQTHALKAVEQLLTDQIPRLPADLSLPPQDIRSDQACVVCASNIQVAHA